MSSLLRRAVQRSTSSPISVDDWVSFFEFGGLAYPFSNMQQTLTGKLENANDSFEGLALAGFKGNGVVFSCMLARQLLFSEARFQWRQRINGRPGDLFGSRELSILEHPWPGGVTADLLSRAIQDVDLAGNFFATRRKGKIRRLRPSWVTIVLGSMEDPTVEAGDIDAEVVGYIYHPGGRGSGRQPVFLLREDVAHFAPIPDPTASFRGMSWLVPIMREFLSDSGMITHKMKFLENGATPNMVVTMDHSIKKEAFKEWVQMFSEKHEGALNAYKTLYLGAGSHLDVVGKDFRQMDFAVTQAAGELRIASAAGVPPSVIGLSEGNKGGSLNAGNFTAHKRLFADGTMRPLWRSAATSLEILVSKPNENAYLWYDDRDIPFLREDIKDAAEVQQTNAAAIKSLIDAGFKPDTVIDAIISGDLKRLEHTGLFSVQLQPPGTILTKGGTPPEKPPEKPVAKPEAKSARDEAMELFKEFLERQQPAPAPQVTVHAAPAPNVEVNINDGALRVEAPVTVEPAQTHIHDGAIRVEPQITVDAPTTISEGAVRVESPVTVHPAEVNINEGAVRSDVHVEPPELHLVDGAIRVSTPVTIAEGAVRVDVAPPELRLENGAIVVESPVTIEEGAVRVDAPVTVERTEVHIDEGAVRVDNPVTVERTEVHVDPGAVSVQVPVSVAPAEVRIEEGAVRVDAPVTIEEGAVRVDAPVTVERTEVKVDAPVTLAEGSVRVDAPVTIERGAVEVQVEQPNVEVNVPPPPPRKRRKVKRETEFRADELGRIIGKSETEEELDDDSQPL